MNKERDNLIIKARQSLKASQLLLTGGYPDFAVARAYYTMFYLASAFLAHKNMSFSKHSAVISAFGREFAKTDLIPRKYHEFLKKAQDLRHLGDYGEIDLIDTFQAQSEIEKAEEFLNFTIDYFDTELS
ncbi:HEPN domain protein [Cyanobacterium stanieri PCC 7202]|uniref:HEPN domain protein n=1 Tax=Cyanobacterium stanieri (strain ATCC 29140 / PCC 7202) TaxID=292563 RepID=K9YKN8_CYASC|nr:HEPN domain protein [Cyanobacterium stanieri PCC 7202]